MTDEAVAPVVAVMLILAIVVTFFAAWNAYYIPAMKAQSEINHIKDVESGFLRFSSDIETAASLKRNMKLSEPVPLGGGDFMFDTVRSGGIIRIWNETEGYMLISVKNGTPVSEKQPSNRYILSAFSYQAVNNFWQDQGYIWSRGTVNVTKGALTTPLQFTTMNTVTYDITGTLFDMSVDPSCSRITIYAVNLSPTEGRMLASGNGNAILTLNSSVTSQSYHNATQLSITLNRHLSGGFVDSLRDVVDKRLAEKSCDNVRMTYRSEISPDVDPAFVMEFDRIPNMTLTQKSVEISMGVY